MPPTVTTLGKSLPTGFLEYQYDLYKSTWGTGARIGMVRKVSEAWARLVRPGDVIITFNWDILHEVILWPSGLWSYRDGYRYIRNVRHGVGLVVLNQFTDP